MKNCIACNEEFEGRSDKIFCTSYCKSDYHYKLAKEKAPSIYIRIDQQLKLNRKLLLHFNHSGKSTIRRTKLINAGFDPAYFTHSWSNSRGQTYKFCYEIGFLKTIDNGKEKFLLINYQESFMGDI